MSTNAEQPLNRLRDFPVSFFATVMGLCGLTLAVKRAEAALEIGNNLSFALFLAAVCLFLALATIYTLKAARYAHAISEEWHHPVRISFFPAMSISLILLGTAAHGFSETASFVFWALGSALHLMMTLSVMTAWIDHSRFEVVHTNPAWFIPIVGNVLVPLVGVHHAPADISWFFFSIGLLFWLILLTLVINRLIFHTPLLGRMVPTLAILLAPPSVAFLSWISLTKTLDPTARILYFAAAFFFLLLLLQIRKFAKLQFALSWWAYSFPLAAFAVATFKMGELSASGFYTNCGFALLLLLTVVIIGLISRTVKAIVKGEICRPEG